VITLRAIELSFSSNSNAPLLFFSPQLLLFSHRRQSVPSSQIVQINLSSRSKTSLLQRLFPAELRLSNLQYKCDDSRLERVLQNRLAEGPLRCRLLALLPLAMNYQIPATRWLQPCSAAIRSLRQPLQPFGVPHIQEQEGDKQFSIRVSR
jgi:hypothetical protein